MPEHRLPIFRRRVGLSSHYSGGPPLTQVNGKNIQPNKKRVKASSFLMDGDSDPLFDPITAPPESSDDEIENTRTENAAPNDSHDSDEDYDRHRAANIRATAFDNATSSTASNARLSKPGTGSSQAYGGESCSSAIDDTSSLVGSKRSAEGRPKAVNQLKRELDIPLQKKKRLSLTKYGSQQKTKRPTASQSTSSSQDIAQPNSVKRSFHRVKSISPIRSQSPRKSFKVEGQSSDLDEPKTSRPSFKNIPLHDSSPISTPGKRRLRHMSSADELAEDEKPKAANINAKRSRIKRRVDLLSKRRGLKGRKSSPDPIAEELSQRPVFKMPGLEDIDSFDDSGSPDVITTPGVSQDTAWDDLEMEEIASTSIPTCPMCHQQVDRELLEKYSTDGKMSVKQQTAFCRLHKQKSAATAGTRKGYPKIDWETIHSRCSRHQGFLQGILEGTQASYYRKVLKERVDSGKNRTLLTNHDNLTPGYYGPRGLQIMTEYIMNTFSDVIRRRAVEDKLISARTYTGYVQTVLVPELTVRLIMEDMSVAEERARNILEESIEIGELLHEEARDVVKIGEKEEDALLEPE
ncbi:RTC4-like domain-containing protein [Xylaria cf. heliscus]|nr:RTC4-like domain-containing protein [Xylaria cf. heliscus]